MKKQGYNSRKDEQLGMTRGKASKKKMSMAGRRKVAKATRKPKGTYGFKKQCLLNRKNKENIFLRTNQRLRKVGLKSIKVKQYKKRKNNGS